MSATLLPPNVNDRIRRYQREFSSLADDLQDCFSSDKKFDRWIFDDCVSKASFLFDRILQLDFDYRYIIGENIDLYSEKEDDQIRDLAHEWFKHTTDLIAKRPSGMTESDELKKLRDQNKQMKNMFTPDDEFFVGEKLEQLEAAAIKAYREGRVEPMVFEDEEA